MEFPIDQYALWDAYVAPFAALAGDGRTGRRLGDVVRGNIAGKVRRSGSPPPRIAALLDRPADP